VCCTLAYDGVVDDGDAVADNSGACGMEEPHGDEGSDHTAVVDNLDLRDPSDTAHVASGVGTTWPV
jgi:hypothetical protein